jgi:hypothetical protein
MGQELDPELLARFISAVGYFSGARISTPKPALQPKVIQTVTQPVSDVMRSNIRFDSRA